MQDASLLTHPSDGQSTSAHDPVRFSPRIIAALEALFEASAYAADLDRDEWEFAVDLPVLWRLKLTKCDLRWLIGKGLIDHAVEVTLSGDADRSFRRTARPLFCKKSCYVLTPAGMEAAHGIFGAQSSVSYLQAEATIMPRLSAPSSVVAAEPLIPKWDRDLQELRVSSVVVKRFRVPAANQEIILAAFEEEHWAPRIDDPLPPHPEQHSKRRLQETIKSLNRNQKRSLIRFVGDGSGQGIRWGFCGDFRTMCGS